jgi:hypothetical protein
MSRHADVSIAECLPAGRYLNSLYWAVTTMVSVGYGDLVPISIPEKVIAMVGMFVGAMVMTYFMGAMTTAISTLSAGHARMARKRQVTAWLTG